MTDGLKLFYSAFVSQENIAHTGYYEKHQLYPSQNQHTVTNKLYFILLCKSPDNTGNLNVVQVENLLMMESQLGLEYCLLKYCSVKSCIVLLRDG